MKRYLPQAVTIVAVFLLAILVSRVSAGGKPGPDLTELINLTQAQNEEIEALKAALNEREEPEPQEAQGPIVIHVYMPEAPEAQVIEVEKVVEIEKEIPVYIEVEKIVEVPVYIEKEPEPPEEDSEPEELPDEPEPPEEEKPEEEPEEEPAPTQINYTLMPVKSNVGIFEYSFADYTLTANFYAEGAEPITHDFNLSALWTGGSLSPGPLPVNPIQSAWMEEGVIYLNLIRFYTGEKPEAEQHTIDVE